MTSQFPPVAGQVVEQEWVSFPGGELEGKRPKALCGGCRAALKRQAAAATASRGSRLLCFECYRAGLDRERGLRAAGEVNTATEARFQSQLPFEPVNRARLGMLKAERSAARAVASQGIGQYADTRRRAQIDARHALQQIGTGLNARGLAPAVREQAMAAAIRAAELQLPESWLPFVVSR